MAHPEFFMFILATLTLGAVIFHLLAGVVMFSPYLAADRPNAIKAYVTAAWHPNLSIIAIQHVFGTGSYDPVINVFGLRTALVVSLVTSGLLVLPLIPL